MDNKTKTDLEKAKALFYSWRLLEAYNIFRRYYDRLPFKPEDEHAEYIGIFVRTLLELGKDFELKFYVSELEKLYERLRTAQVGFQLGYVYTSSSPGNTKRAIELLEDVLKNPAAKPFHNKTRICLAFCYDVIGDNTAACKHLIDSIEEPIDPMIFPNVVIWRAKILKDLKRFKEGEALLTELLSQLSPKENWHAYFLAKHTLAINKLEQGETEVSSQILEEMKSLFEGHQFKSVKLMLDLLNRRIEEKSSLGCVQVEKLEGETKLRYGSQVVAITKRSFHEKLLMLLLKRKKVSKDLIIKTLYRRDYVDGQDDKLIYYHVHSLRKFLKILGLPNGAITVEESNYQFVPEVMVMEPST